MGKVGFFDSGLFNFKKNNSMKTNLFQPVPELPVRDVVAAQEYYRDFLGFEITWTYPGNYIGAVARGDVGIFFRVTEEPFVTNIHWMAADDVDATYIEMKEGGAKIIDAIENKPWDIRQFTIEDLNGHIFYIFQANK
jgi:predicted enzyme related to lactoylglutathione lyase